MTATPHQNFPGTLDPSIKAFPAAATTEGQWWWIWVPAEKWYAMHDHGHDYGAHQHFPENQGHGSHENIPLVPYQPTYDPRRDGS